MIYLLNINEMDLIYQKNFTPLAISETEQKIIEWTKENETGKILMMNKYEMIVPYNLWFRDENYKVVDFRQNNQFIRVRYYKGHLLTPLTVNKGGEETIHKFIPHMSSYQPSYPERFFEVIEIMNIFQIFANRVLSICMPNNVGGIESIMIYHEILYPDYKKNNYYTLLHNETDYYNSETKMYDYIGQIFHHEFIDNTAGHNNKDLVHVDMSLVMKHKWNDSTVRKQYNLNIYYLLKAIETLVIGGILIFRLSIFHTEEEYVLIDLIEIFFEKVYFYRPMTTNIFDNHFYVIASRKEPTTKLDIINVLCSFDSDVYCYISINNIFRISSKHLPKSKLRNTYNSFKDGYFIKVMTEITNSVQPDPSVRVKALEEWHAQMNLSQVKDFTKEFSFDSLQYKYNFKSGHYLYDNSFINIVKSNDVKTILQNKKRRLNYYKRVMDTKPSMVHDSKYRYNDDHFITWNHLQNQIDVFKHLKHTIQTRSGAEMVTNAWIKLYEILTCDHFIVNFKNLKTFHLCEAPGAFIASLNHYLYSFNIDAKWEWYAQTLNSELTEDKTVLADYYGLIGKYKNRWLFGDDQTGDITKKNIIKSYINDKRLQNINFMTADGGLQIPIPELNEQESYVSKIIYGEVLTILGCLVKGGNAIIKMFLPLAEPLTISVIYLINIVFHETRIFKPQTSNSPNSEVYFILRDYKKNCDTIINKLIETIDEVDSDCYLFNISEYFMREHEQISSAFIDRQIKSLNRCYYYYYNWDKINETKSEIKNNLNMWMNKHFIKRGVPKLVNEFEK